MKIVVPMAGRGSRFADRGITTPKPLIDVMGSPMLTWALRSVKQMDHSALVFVILREHDELYQLSDWLKEIYGSQTEVICLDAVTEGQLCTVLAAREFIDTDEDVLVISSDTFVISNIKDHISNRLETCAGIISVANMPGERWSFARTDVTGKVVEVAEKKRISDHASTGMYYFAHGHQLIEVGDKMIRNNEKTRGEYYVIPVYQKYIEQGLLVTISKAQYMWDMGTPEALELFIQHLTENNGAI